MIARLLPAGFRAMAAVALLSAALGLAQLCALPFRDEPHPLAAALLALLLLGGGLVIAAFVRRNAGEAASAPTTAAPEVFVGAALGLIAAEALYVAWSSGIFFPLRMALLTQGALTDRLFEPALPMMLAGTSLLAMGAGATASLLGALWLWLYARGLHGERRALGALLAFAGAVPYVAFALLVRAILCRPVAFLAAGRFLALRPDDRLAYASLFGMAPGLLSASVLLGLAIGRGLFSWLEEVRAAEESSDSFVAARVRGLAPWEILLRHGLWLRRRRELGALLLGGMAAAVFIDVLSNTLIDSFRPPGFPLYPSLGAALFLRGIGPDGAPAALASSWSFAHVVVVGAAMLLVLAQAFPRGQRRSGLRDGVLHLGGAELLRGVAGAHGLSPRPALQWVLGPSGAGKTLLLRAWAAQLPDALLVPQDPDEALPAALSATDVAGMARPKEARALWDLLGRLDDDHVRSRLLDPFTSVSSFSRGERQRLLFCLALARARCDADCTLLLDEPTSAQDPARTQALLDCLREFLPPQFAGAGSLVLTSHDPEAVDALLGDRAPQAVTDHVLWLDGGRAHEFAVRAPLRWEGPPRPPALQRYLDAAGELLAARSQGPAPDPRESSGGVRLLGPRLAIAGLPHLISPEAQVRPGELVVLSGASGSGKTTLLRAVAARPLPAVEMGYVMQDTARAYPLEMPVREVLGARPRSDRVRHWFGPIDDALLSRPIGVLSEGERQRVLLAAEVLRLEASPRSRLRLLLLDEP
ncbi:MAG TPA: ATP-binding cassette domain-containing protein, partial [Myxococcales bacterium]|nr:ATP-binding cassette domain-containing protein [Myxococcales bacterium]